MDITTFKNKCKSKKDEIDSKKVRFQRILREQEQYNEECYKPKETFFKKKCPVCDEPLVTELVEKRNTQGEGIRDIIYSCPCGYEYAVTE